MDYENHLKSFSWTRPERYVSVSVHHKSKNVYSPAWSAGDPVGSFNNHLPTNASRLKHADKNSKQSMTSRSKKLELWWTTLYGSKKKDENKIVGHINWKKYIWVKLPDISVDKQVFFGGATRFDFRQRNEHGWK